jgi:hypothetical protein
MEKLTAEPVIATACININGGMYEKEKAAEDKQRR